MSTEQLARLLRQDNPGPMTLDGTNTWVLYGDDAAVVIDPGEDSEEHPAAAHLDALLSDDRPIALVLLTHRHHDHSGAAAALHERTGAPVRAVDPEHCHGGGVALLGGELVESAGLRIRVMATPGHTSDSVCFVPETVDGPLAVLSGDTILGRGTTVVAHPDGRLGPYLDSLERLRGLGVLPVLPGHGPTLPSIADVAAQYLAHRAERLDQVRAALTELGPDASARQIVELVYADVDRAVWGAAELSVHAQLDYLRDNTRPPAG